MLTENGRWYLSAVWLLAALLTFFVVNLTPVTAVLLTLAATTLPLMLLLVWNDTPTLSATIAEITHPRSR